jgi:hypothetical protein
MLEPEVLNYQQKEQELTRKNLQSKPIFFRLFSKAGRCYLAVQNQMNQRK